MGWEKGPLPPGTYNWGGVVPVCETCRGSGKITDRSVGLVTCPLCKGVGSTLSGGFYFADFHGDSVTVSPDTPQAKRLTADEVAWWNNALDLPPTGFGRVKLEGE